MGILSEFQKTVIFFGEAICVSTSLILTVLLSKYGVIQKFDANSKSSVAFLYYFIALMIICWARLIDESLYSSPHRHRRELFAAQCLDLGITVGIFYCIPFFGHFPSQALLVYIGFFVLLSLTWRLSGVFLIGLWGRRRAVLIAMGDDPKTLFCDTNKDRCYPIEYSALVILNTSPEDEGSSNSMVLREAVAEGADLIVTDLRQKGRVDYYARLFPRICFADYDSVFERYYGRKPRHGPGEG